jgi:hypothetical protein
MIRRTTGGSVRNCRLSKRWLFGAIDGPLGIETGSTVWQKHLYELAGFKRFLGPDAVATLAKGEALRADAKIDLPMIRVELRQRAPYGALTALAPVEFGQEGSILHLRTRSKDQCIWFQVHLDFANERLCFDAFNDLRACDDGTVGGGRATGRHQPVYL